MPSLEQNLIYKSFKDFSKNLKDFEVFIETGTFMGDTSKTASDIFKKVYTIEVHESLYKQAIRRFENTNVLPIFGDSIIQLPILLQELNNSNIFFWLDGHNSGPGTGIGQIDFPLLSECIAIDNYFNGKECLILIDDVRLFGKGHTNEIDDSLKTITVNQVLNIFKKRTINSYRYYDSEICLNDRLMLHII